MTFENSDQVVEEIKKFRIVPKWVVDAREYHKTLKALVYGQGFKEELLRIEHIEPSEEKAKARQKYARSIKDVNSRILAPVNNVYSATGGGKEFPGLEESQVKTLLPKLADVRGGLSLERWLERFWSQDLYVVDPAGITFLEWKDEDVWPTYKSIDRIRTYKPDGQNMEYVMFEPIEDIEHIEHEGSKLWRVVDDAMDYTLRQSGEFFTVVEELTFVNPFGKCQGRINSDIHQFGRGHRISPIDKIIETEKEILRDRSILTMYKFLNGFSIPYRPGIICPDCKGLGKTGDKNCKSCNGKGLLFDKDVVHEIILPVIIDTDEVASLPSNFAGYISPDLEIWDQYRKEGKELTNEAFEAVWNTRETEEVKDQTAQGAILNIQPMTARLNGWSDVAQSQEWFYTELYANFYIDKDNAERVSVITYGRNYIIQPPSYLLEQYRKAGVAEDPIVIRDRQLVEYLTAKYKNDPSTLREQLLKKALEPYVHYSIETVEKVYGKTEAQRKGLFTDWWESLKDKNEELSSLEKQRDTWTDAKIATLKTDTDGKNSSS